MEKSLKTIKIDHNFKNYLAMKLSHFSNVIETYSKFGFLISNSTLLKDLIFWLNQFYVNCKPHVFNLLSLCVTPRS